MTSTSRAVPLGAIGLVAIAAWIITVDRMQGMDTGPGTDLGELGWFAGVWVVMMAAMMLPSLVPVVLAHPRKTRFVVGYLVPWTIAGVLAYALFEAVRALDIGFLGWDEGGRYVVAGVLVGAALYELTPLKDACLSECRDPSRRSGIAHGAWCVGCCWALMAALFALGVMSVAWMVVVAAMIAAEKLLPWKAAATRGVAVVLLALAIGVALAPDDVPGLTVPDSAMMS